MRRVCVDGATATHTPHSTALVVDITDDLDMSTIDSFRRAFGALLGEAPAGLAPGDVIVLDLSLVKFLSIDGTSALVEARDLTLRHSVGFRLVTAAHGVERALAATGTRRSFECHPTVESALAADSPLLDVLTHPART
ncbi:STAS domain-containing protein [Prescottella defluvii]|uniref:STAS domain-containing protein n=1 Tax=Prescottella defluvii TaxID=1323361 RepID=UPI00068D3AA7|nr:STAS domain-containing protein [Prescottella defluvii]